MRVADLPGSSVLSWMAYDDATSQLTLEFRSGDAYRYFLVPAQVYEELLAAPSAGSYFTSMVRDRYPQTQVKSRFDP